MTLDWIPEAYPASGGLAADGFYKLLGRPRMDPLTVLVRETAQNSWDARRNDEVPVGFRLEGRHVSETVRAALIEEVFAYAGSAQGTNLAVGLEQPDLGALFISDRNTIGLGGPVQADQEDQGKVYDWVDFVLNVGKANTGAHRGHIRLREDDFLRRLLVELGHRSHSDVSCRPTRNKTHSMCNR